MLPLPAIPPTTESTRYQTVELSIIYTGTKAQAMEVFKILWDMSSSRRSSSSMLADSK